MINCLHCGEEIFDLLRTKPPLHFSCLSPYINNLKARVDGLEATSVLYYKLQTKLTRQNAAIDAAQAVANSYYGTENEEFEPLIDALADALAALRGKTSHE